MSSPVSGFDKRKAQLKTVYKKRELKQERKDKQKTYQKTADKKRNKGSDKRQANLKTMIITKGCEKTIKSKW